MSSEQIRVIVVIVVHPREVFDVFSVRRLCPPAWTWVAREVDPNEERRLGEAALSVETRGA